jgi:hypothetical protein
MYLVREGTSYVSETDVLIDPLNAFSPVTLNKTRSERKIYIRKINAY